MKEENSIVAVETFIQSTRDSGYKSTASAVSELVDNSIQASAKSIEIVINQAAKATMDIGILDDGVGMTKTELRQSLRFGSSTRFDSRSGIGRFGMGLPNASLSQTERVEVYSWRNKRSQYTYLDVNEIASGSCTEVTEPVHGNPPDWLVKPSDSGTAIVWLACDRLDYKLVGVLKKHLIKTLGQTFRFFIWDGIQISVDGEEVQAIDPLYLKKSSLHSGAVSEFETWTCEVRSNPDDVSSEVGTVQVRFSELPLQKWANLSNDEKRKLGVSKGAGVSIVRGDREVDFGWFFMGGKRKENYDDWWRCEIRFPPSLDELFGITHTKQQVRPHAIIREAITPYVEQMAKTLNSRVRKKFTSLSLEKEREPLNQVISKVEERLTPVATATIAETKKIVKKLKSNHPRVMEDFEGTAEGDTKKSSLVRESLNNCDIYTILAKGGSSLTVVNDDHPFAKKVLAECENPNGSLKDLSQYLKLVIHAAARSEAIFSDPKEQALLKKFRSEWSKTLSALLAKK